MLLLFILFVGSAALTISPSSAQHYRSISLLDYHLFSVLILIFCAFLCHRISFSHSSLPPTTTHTTSNDTNPLPPSHLFLWPWSMRLNASTLLPIISRTQLSHCPPPRLLLPFVLQTGLSLCLFYSGQNPTPLNRQRDSWSLYCLSLRVCVGGLGIRYLCMSICVCLCSGHLEPQSGCNANSSLLLCRRAE